MKEIDIYGPVRRDVLSGDVPKHEMETNAKNRYNILVAISIKGSVISPVEYVVLEECTNSTLFLQFVFLMDEGCLERGDISWWITVVSTARVIIWGFGNHSL